MSTVFTGNPYMLTVGIGNQFSCTRLDDIILESRGYIDVYSGGVVSKAVVNNGGVLTVHDGGTAYDLTVNNFLGVDGTVVGISVNCGAYVANSWDTARFYALADGGYIEKMSDFVASGNVNGLDFIGTLYTSNATLKDCVVNISSGQNGYNRAIAYLMCGTVMSGGVVCGLGSGIYSVAHAILSSGCRAVGTLIDGGSMAVSSGAVVSGVLVDGGGTLRIDQDGTAIDTVVTGNGVLSAAGSVSGTVLRDGTQMVKNGVVSDTVVSNGGVDIISAGTGYRTIVSSGGTESVEYSGYSRETTVCSGGTQVIFARAENTEVYGLQYLSTHYSYLSNTHIHSGGSLVVDRGGDGNLQNVRLDDGASMTMLGGHAGDVSAVSGAMISVDSNSGISGGSIGNGVVLYAEGTLRDIDVYNDITASRGYFYDLRLHSGAVLTAGNSTYLSHTVVSSGAELNISGGSFYNTVPAGGTVNFFSCNYQSATVSDGRVNNLGGSARYTDVFAGGKVTATRSAVEYGANVFGGRLEILDGSYLSSASVSGGNTLIGSGASAGYVSVCSGGRITIENGGNADYLTLRGGVALCNGNLSHSYVYDGGALYASAATLYGGTVFSGGTLLADRLSVSGGVTMQSGSILDFLIAYRTGDGAAVIDDFSRFSGTTTMYITVSADQQSGEYILAENAGGFTGGVFVDSIDSDQTLGTLFLDEELKSGNCTYSLAKNADKLTLTVTNEAPVPLTGAMTGDLDGDGRADVVMTITQSGHGAEGATGAWLIQNDQTAAWGDLSQRNAGWEIFGMGVTTAGKATNDVYIKNVDNIIGAWVTDDSGHVAGWETIGQFDGATRILGLGDFNADGQTDLLLRNDNGAVGCYFTGGEKTGWNYFQSLGDEWRLAAVGDFNADGRADVVLVHDAGFAGTWLTQADGTVAWADLDTLGEGFSIAGCGDFDGDGTDDVLLRKGTYFGAWLVENGGAKAWFGIGDLGDVTVEQVADFDNDGRDDLRIRTSAGDLGSQLVRGADTLEWRYYGSVGEEWSTRLAAI